MKTRILMLAAFSLSACRGWETEERPVHLIKNMDTQEKGKAYRRDSTGLFADGRISRLPVEGTVAQGQLADDTQLEDGLEQEEEATKTFPASVTEKWDDSVARGLNRYTIYCAPCHGGALDGNGTVAGVALDGGPRFQGVKSLHTEHAAKELRVGELYRIVKNGQNTMPSYAAQIPVADRWAIVAYVKQAQIDKDSTVPREPGGLAQVGDVKVASAEVGAQLYKTKTCSGCHSIDGTRLVGPSFKGLWGRTEEFEQGGSLTADLAYFIESVKQPNAKTVKTYPPVMPVLPVTDIEIESIALYVQTLK